MVDERKILLILTAVLAVRFAVLPIIFDTPRDSLAIEEEVVEQTTSPNLQVFSNLGLESKSAYVYDLREKKALYAFNEDDQLPLASITKLMTALVAYENLSAEQIVSVGSRSLDQDGDNGLVLSESWKVRDLVDFTLVGSSNDGAHALAAAISPISESVVENMNKKAQDLGLLQTYFLNETGLDIDDETNGGAFGSARDVAVLFSHILSYAPDLFESTRENTFSVTSLSGFPHHIDNTNEIVNTIPWLVGSKTGFTDVAGGNLAVVFDVGLARPVVVVVLGSTPEGRFTDVEKLVTATFKAFTES